MRPLLQDLPTRPQHMPGEARLNMRSRFAWFRFIRDGRIFWMLVRASVLNELNPADPQVLVSIDLVDGTRDEAADALVVARQRLRDQRNRRRLN